MIEKALVGGSGDKKAGRGGEVMTMRFTRSGALARVESSI